MLVPPPPMNFVMECTYYVCAVFDGPQQNWRSDGVVDYERNAVLVRDAGQALDICNIARGIADAFAIDGPRVFVDQCIHFVRTVGLREFRVDPALGEDMRQQRVRRPVELGDRHDVGACFGNVDQRIFDRRHPRTHAEPIDSAFEGSNTFFEDRVGGVADAGVDIPFNF